MKFAVLGHPIAHSRSPAMHTANFAALGLDATYEAFDVTAAELPATLDSLQRRGYRGLNLTIPLKARGLELAHETSELARLLGGVNTLLLRPDGSRYGDNTDGYGFTEAVAEAGFGPLTGRVILVLGCGGTGRALALTAASGGVGRLLLANRTRARAQEVADAVGVAFPRVAVEVLPSEVDAWAAAAAQADLVIHTTSQGLNPQDPSLLPSGSFRPGQLVFDAVYTSHLTPILLAASQAGASTLNGIGMLVHQGAQSFRLWTGLSPDLAAMHHAAAAGSHG